MRIRKPINQLYPFRNAAMFGQSKGKQFLRRAKRLAIGIVLGSSIAGTAAFAIAKATGKTVLPKASANRQISTRQAAIEAKPRFVLETKQKRFSVFSAQSGIVLLPGEQQVSASIIETELKKANSPAVGLGNAFVEFGNFYGIKASVALALFKKESNFGTRGLATQTKSIGNIRYSPPKKNGVQYSNYNGFRQYASWEDGLKDFFDFLSSARYSGKTLEETLNIYAPSTENNTARYIKQTVNYVNQLQSSSELPS